MADIATLSATVSRDLLGLAPLEIAVGGRYYLAPQFLGGAVQWTRQQVTSPFVDGQVTTQRMRQNVTEQIGVEIRASNHADLQAYTAELIDAFLQHSYTFTLNIESTLYAWRCEAADYQVATFTTPRIVGLAGQVLFTVQRQPVALIGGI